MFMVADNILEFQAMDINRNTRTRGDDEIMAVMRPVSVAGHQETLYCNSKYGDRQDN